MMIRGQSREKNPQNSSHAPLKGHFGPRSFIPSISEQQASFKEASGNAAQFGQIGGFQSLITAIAVVFERNPCLF